jgi:hypothetical protein
MIAIFMLEKYWAATYRKNEGRPREELCRLRVLVDQIGENWSAALKVTIPELK